jgi:hypothetical protein
VHEGIVAVFDTDILQFNVLAIPQVLLAIGKVGVFHINAIHSPEELGRIYLAVGHSAIARIPHAAPCAFGKVAIVHLEPVRFPEDILAFETAVLRFYVIAFLDG